MGHERGRGGRRFQDRAIGGEVAAQHGDSAALRQGLLQRPNDLVVPTGGIAVVLPDGASVGGHRILVDQARIAQAADDRRQPAGIIEILHQETAGGHQIDDGGHVVTQAVPIGEREVDPDAARDRQQMHDRVGRAADGAVDPNGILEGLAREQP